MIQQCEIFVFSQKHQPIDQKINAVREAHGQLLRLNNERILREANISYDELIPGKCHGFAWAHSQISCRYKADFNLGTAAVRLRKELNAVTITERSCWQCRADSRALGRWVKHGHYNAQNERLCTRESCQEPLVTLLDCENHRASRQEDALERKARMMARLNNSEPGEQLRKTVKNRQALWKVVSMADISKYFTTLASLETGPWDWHPQWKCVAASATSNTYCGPKVFHIDTESTRVVQTRSLGGKEELVPLEICILDGRGKVALMTTIDYGMSVGQLLQGSKLEKRMLSKACQIYSVQGPNGMTRGMTPSVLQKSLFKLGFRRENSILVEHSTSDWDWRALANIVGEKEMPEAHVTTFEILRLTGYAGPKDLQIMFLLAFPHSALHKKHHRALWDVSKMYILLVCIFQHRIVRDDEVASIIAACEAFNWNSSLEDEYDERDELVEMEDDD